MNNHELIDNTPLGVLARELAEKRERIAELEGQLDAANRHIMELEIPRGCETCRYSLPPSFICDRPDAYICLVSDYSEWEAKGADPTPATQ